MNGVAEGPYSLSHLNGKVAVAGDYREGEKFGRWGQYNEGCGLVATGAYRAGQFVQGAPVAGIASC